ncbi:O-antigen ligase family protein [Gemelliphila palaticanis]|uniref:O-antigen ligase family protein n=1 Tax=Gemelliphila palaticanis TaxID=81950 RepID=A0ABX2SZ83_9BACL|nr:O-antigen ligase family protein [Gemella palaticanis]MBF0715447.1 O-antigen ligase family protein [Gemella palaticanis]NYS47377.1 O-antigen ligase family protein [Gemella palaticanis]
MNFMKEKIDSYNYVVKVYIYLTIICHILFLMSPIVTFIVGTPLYSFQKYFAGIGILLVLIDIIFYRFIFKLKYAYIFYSIFFVSIVSSLYTVKYGIKHNLFDILWYFIIVSIFYSYTLRLDKELFKKQLLYLYNHVAFIWSVGCILSIPSFLFNVGYYSKVNPHYIDGYIRQGFLENRLFGIFMAMYNSAMTSSVLLVIGIFIYLVNKKNYLLFYNVLFITHILLSGTRSSMISLIFTFSILIGYYVFCKNINYRHFKKIGVSILAFITSCLLIYGGFSLYKKALSYVPNIYILKSNQNNYHDIIQKFPMIKKEELKDKSYEHILEREDANFENPSNNRLDIWLDYFKIYKEIGFIGLSPNNYSKYIQEHAPDLFIVQYVKDSMPERYKNGDIYEPHNSYLYLYVSTGLIGLSSFMIFLIILIIKILKYLNQKRYVDTYFYMSISLIIFYLSNMFFDSIVLFDNDAITIVFWLLLGFVTKIVSK